MRNRAKSKLKRIKAAFKAFVVIIKKEKHVFYSQDYCSLDANVHDILRYIQEMRNLVDIKLDDMQMQKITNDIHQILNDK